MANLHAWMDTGSPAAGDGGVAGLFRASYPEMVRLADLLGADDPEDIAQEAFARLIRKHGSLRDPGAALAYVRAVRVRQARPRRGICAVLGHLHRPGRAGGRLRTHADTRGPGSGQQRRPRGYQAGREHGDGRLGRRRLPGGRTVPGVLVSGRGFPHRVWAVVYPLADNATIVFRDRAGHEAGHLSIQGSPPWPHRPRSGGIGVFRYPAGPEGPRPGAMTAYLIGGKVAFWNSDNSDSAMGNVPAAGPPAVAVLEGNRTRQATAVELYGYAHQNVARVALRLAGGLQYDALTFAAWPGSGLRLWAFSVPARSLTGRPGQAVMTGYDAAGHVVWQQRLGG